MYQIKSIVRLLQAPCSNLLLKAYAQDTLGGCRLRKTSICQSITCATSFIADSYSSRSTYNHVSKKLMQRDEEEEASCYLLIIRIFTFVCGTISGNVLEQARRICEIFIEVSMCIKVVNKDLVFMLGVEHGDTSSKQVIVRFHHFGNSLIANMGWCMLHRRHIDNQERAHTIRVKRFLSQSFMRQHTASSLYYHENACKHRTNCSL